MHRSIKTTGGGRLWAEYGDQAIIANKIAAPPQGGSKPNVAISFTVSNLCRMIVSCTFLLPSFFTETNSFAPFPTDATAFQTFGFWRGTASIEGVNGQGAALAELRRLTENLGGNLTESICAFAQPARPTDAGVYADLKAQILEDLQASLPVDAVILALHGAMIAERVDDCEGDLLAAVREIVGTSVPIGVTLDLHCHITEPMLSHADVMIAYKEYPHVDRMR